MEKKNNSNLQELCLKDKIVGKKCDECDQLITEENYKDKNYTLWFSVDDYNWETFDDRTKLTLNITAITHEKTFFYDCPDVGTCYDCEKKFLETELKRGIDVDPEEPTENNNPYYCQPCFNKKYGDYLKKRAKRKNYTPEQKEAMQTIEQVLNEHLSSQFHKTPGNGYYGKCEGSDCLGYKQTLESYGIK